MLLPFPLDSKITKGGRQGGKTMILEDQKEKR